MQAGRQSKFPMVFHGYGLTAHDRMKFEHLPMLSWTRKQTHNRVTACYKIPALCDGDAQAEALNQPGVLHGRSLVFSAPTSGGKSAVAEVLMLRRLCEPRTADKVALLVLPFVSLCQEKEARLERLLKPLNK